MNISFIKIFKVVNVSKKIQVAKFDGNDEKWSRIFYFEISLALSETLKVQAGFQNKNLDYFLPSKRW